MKTNQIHYFLRVCDTLNFTRAAEVCHVSQPSLSAAIHQLEDEFGGALFDRSGRQVQLTTLGKSMRVHLSRIEEAQNAAAVAASEIVQGKLSVVNIGVMCTLSPHKLLSAVSQLKSEFQGTELIVHDIREPKALELLSSGAIDCIFMAHTTDLAERFCVTKLTEEPMIIAMHHDHPAAGKDKMSYDELKCENYVDRLHCEFRENIFKELTTCGVDMHVVLRSEREDLVAAAVSNGVGISVMPESTAQSFGLVSCKLEGLDTKREISVVTVKDRPLYPLVEKLVQIISQS